MENQNPLTYLSEKARAKYEKKKFAIALLRKKVSTRDIQFAVNQKFPTGISSDTLTQYRKVLEQTTSESQHDSEMIQELEQKIESLLDQTHEHEQAITQLLRLFMAFNGELRQNQLIDVAAFKKAINQNLDLSLIDKYQRLIA